MKTPQNSLSAIAPLCAFFSRGLLCGLLMSACTSCDAQNGDQTNAQNGTGNVPSNPAASEPTPDRNVGDTPDSQLVRELPESAQMPSGEYSWPRLLGETFDGKGSVPRAEFDWSHRPEVVWRLPVGEGYGLGSVASGRYYHFDASDQTERLRAFDLASGQVLWSVAEPLEYRDMYGYESGPRGTPTIKGDRIYTFGVGGQLCCRDLSDGMLIWSVQTNDVYGVVQNFFGVGSSPLLTDDLVIVHVGGSPPEDQRVAPGRLDRVISNGSALVAFDRMTGKERWRGGEDLASYSSPRSMVVDGTPVVLQFAREHLLALNASDGDVLWKFRHRAEILESINGIIPVVESNRVFISECYQIGSVLLEVSSDAAVPIWQDPPKDRRKQAMRSHWSTPALIDGHLYGCSGRNNPDSDFRCVEFSSGKVKWKDDRSIRSSVTQIGDQLLVWEEDGRLEIINPTPEKLDVVAEHNLDDLVTRPCWAAPIVVGNRILIRGDENIVCLAVPWSR